MLVDWDPRFLYAKLIDSPDALEDFCTRVVTRDWHFQHDAGRPFAETSVELAGAYPEHRSLIEQFGPRFNETIPGPIAGMPEIVAALDAGGVPLFGITNFSAEFWPPFRAREEALFAPFRDIVVSGEERLVKPDPAIFHLALARFGLEARDALFIDDRADNVAGAASVGMAGHVFRDAETLRADLAGLGLL